jgi:hypothetical protein
MLILGLDAWLSNNILDPADFPPQVHPLLASQVTIGWGHLFQGRFSLEWTTLQDQYLQEIGLYHSDTNSYDYHNLDTLLPNVGATQLTCTWTRRQN